MEKTSLVKKYTVSQQEYLDILLNEYDFKYKNILNEFLKSIDKLKFVVSMKKKYICNFERKHKMILNLEKNTITVEEVYKKYISCRSLSKLSFCKNWEDFYVENINSFVVSHFLEFDFYNPDFYELQEVYKKYPKYLSLNEKGEIIISKLEDVLYKEENNFEKIKVEKEIEKKIIKAYEKGMKIIEEKLLNSEKIRADIEPYDKKILQDPNRGHWDLWMNDNENYENYVIELDEEFVARDPKYDINENGVIAIDFGTKSTVVVYQNDSDRILPMRIGDGNIGKINNFQKFENPTIMHFVNLKKFLTEYASKKGRPLTNWEDLTISHTALDQLSNSKSDEYYEYLFKLKQWAGQRKKQFRIKSHDSESRILPSFLDLKEGDFDPIEIYAYYIGLYINNMRKGHGIFLNYYLSFPVTYEYKIRKGIIESFEKGLKKSLPERVLNDDEVMKKFRINGEISEPTAYAVCALQEYGFDPSGDEKVFYGIFDFGGGTTDFDFGIWKESKKNRYDYTIETFGAGGDEYLGGENILEIIAFEIFKENQNFMKENGFTFNLAPKCTEFLGSDALLVDSQEAEKNMNNLIEKIRPYWENNNINSELNELKRKIKENINVNEQELEEIEKIKDEEQKIEELQKIAEKNKINIDNIEIVLDLFNKNGEMQIGQKIYFSRKKMKLIIENLIKDGINNFMSSLLLAYHQNKDIEKIKNLNILLAGNSSKSPIVEKLFRERIAIEEEKIKKENKNLENVEGIIKLYPPLGTKKAYEIMGKENKETIDKYEEPTCKTGVAFGLIQCRKGGKVECINKNRNDGEEIFQYYIGKVSKKKFIPFNKKITDNGVKVMGKPNLNEWYEFIEADENEFDIYYTTLPECISGEMVVTGNAAVKRLHCEISEDEVNENYKVYIRAITTHTIEYVVSKGTDVEKEKISKIYIKEL